MAFPRVRHWPLFICESCTVRRVVDRELGAQGDLILLKLERMRILDFANSWAVRTYAAYGSKLAFIRGFEQRHSGVFILPVVRPDSPPTHPGVPLAWAELAHSVRPSPSPDRLAVSLNTTRQLRSAVGWHHTVSLLLGSFTRYVFDDRQQRLLQFDTAVNSDAGLGQFVKGLRGRIGEDSRPSWALRDRHIRAFDGHFDSCYRSSTSRTEKLHWSRAGMANLFLWLGWLRSSELFGIRGMDLDLIPPGAGGQFDLPPAVGAILLRLSEKTKTDRFSTADVPIAHATCGGLQPGRWVARYTRHRLSPLPLQDDPSLLFVTDMGTPWTSHCYRHEFVYPLLYQLQLQGDPFLHALKGQVAGNTIPDKFKSLHMYRRGANSHVEVVRSNDPRRKATRAEQYEHARWSVPRSSEPIHVMYREWSLWDRLQITLACM